MTHQTRRHIAQVGVGKWGTKLLAEFQKHADVTTIARTDSFEEKLQDPSVEAVVIATPPATHLEIARKALTLGKDVFIEKPCGTSSKEAEEIAALAKEKNRIVMVGYIFLYHSAFLKIKDEFQKRGERIKTFFASRQKWGSFEATVEETHTCHDVAMALSLSPSLTLSPVTQGEHLAAYAIDGGMEGLIVTNRLAQSQKKTFTFEGDKGSLFVWEDELLFEKKNGELVPVAIEPMSALERECRTFFDSLATRETPESDAHFAARVHSLLGE